MTLGEAVAAAITEATGLPFRITSQTAVGGGDINECHRLEASDGSRYFLKLNEARHAAMLAAEAAGLEAIAATRTVRVPQVIAAGSADGRSFLVLEHLELCAKGNERLLGEQLAAMHRCTVGRFGMAQDNFIGTTPQPNGWTNDWISFWRERRLGQQLKLARQDGHGRQLQEAGERLMDALPSFFAGYTPLPSLLHGDLWGGNHGFLADGTPVIYDPAVYHGDRECDLAMTELFGGYGAGFYEAYRTAWPLDAGYEVRRELYNLYHVLNHALLFGGHYARQAEGMMLGLLAKAGAG